MTRRQLLGYAIVALPFFAIFIFAATQHGILAAAGIFGAVAAIVALILVGVEMTL